jgi:geranylgeranyl pyrophosphate synthase
LRALGNVDLSLPAYVDIITKKTATLFAASAECGAIMGRGDRVVVNALRDFGHDYGIAFQMLDDVLDVTANEAQVGKPVGNDVRERKVTMPVIFAMQSGDANLRDRLQRFYAGDAVPQEREVHEMLRAIGAAGAVERTREAIAGYVERAKMSLSPLESTPARAHLVELAEALVR